MDGFLALAFLGCVFYSGKVILDFVSHESVVTPKVKFLESESTRLEAEAEEEAVYTAGLRDRILSVGEQVDALRRRMEGLRHDVDTERARQQRLQVALYKRRIRDSRRVLIP